MATSGGRLNPYKLGVELYRNIEDRWNKGQFGKEWEECDDLEAKRKLESPARPRQEEDLRGALALYNDVTFIDEFLTPDFCRDHKLFSFSWSNRNERFEIETREFKAGEGEAALPADQRGKSRSSTSRTRTSRIAGSCLLRHDHQGDRSARGLRKRGHEEPRARVEAAGEREHARWRASRSVMRFDGKDQAARQAAYVNVGGAATQRRRRSPRGQR